MSCKSCRPEDLVIDDTSGLSVCSLCGLGQDFNHYQHQFGGISGPQGAFVHVGTVGAGTVYSYKERKLYESSSIIKDITNRLDLSVAHADEVKDMVSKVIEGEFGLGNWFPVLVGACCYIVMRKANKTLPISEVAGAVCCDLYEMGSMVSRVVQFLGCQLPEFDIVGMLERMIRSFSRLRMVDESKVEVMVQQGIFIVQCTIKWFLTTGQRPGPVAAAVFVFVGKLNGASVKIEEVAKDANASVDTCKKRYNELVEMLVKVAQKLPWGKDVNAKNIVKNAPLVIKYMELKSREEVGKKRKRTENSFAGSTFALEELIDECLSGTVEYTENDSQYCSNEVENRNGGGAASLSMSELENLKVSHDENLARIYSEFNTNASRMKLTAMKGQQSRPSYYNLPIYDDWWTGRSELCKKVMGEKVAEKDVGLDVLPPSYICGCQQVQRRKQKIKDAKTRIRLIASRSKSKGCRTDVNLVDGNDVCVSENGNGGKKRKKTKNRGIDWEDFIIEALLLHQVKEEEIEKGQYNTLLDLHVFNSGV